MIMAAMPMGGVALIGVPVFGMDVFAVNMRSFTGFRIGLRLRVFRSSIHAAVSSTGILRRSGGLRQWEPQPPRS